MTEPSRWGPASEVAHRGTWSALRPAGHHGVCWAAALGRARQQAPLDAPDLIPPRAAGLVDEFCLCRPASRGGRRR